MTTYQTIRFVLGDQLTRDVSSLADANPDTDLIVMAEPQAEATYVPHHRQKIVLILSALRHFAKALRDEGFVVDYYDYKTRPTKSFTDALRTTIDQHDVSKVIITEPGEWRVRQEIENWSSLPDVKLEIRPDDRFFAPLLEFEEFAKGRKELRMEYFYRGLRRNTGILMEPDGKPVGGQWNFDHDNRKTLPDDLTPHPPKSFAPDPVTRDLLDLAYDDFPDGLGSVESFGWAVTRQDALMALDHFIDHRLACFGDYQDAMTVKSATVYHSLISPYINIGLLLPDEVCRAAERAYHDGKAPLNAVEGFIRQILGWREYVRGLYWFMGPDYVTRNHFEAKRALPAFFWDGDVSLNCLKQAIGETLENAYAHHIQRLMVIGNFSLLTGLSVQEVCEWYLAVYIDAFEWVELPNTLGMALYADGGTMASKPYAASGKYIDRMSDYCQGCPFNPRKNIGSDACPFNALYWHFLDRHADVLGNNARLRMPYQNWARMKDADKESLIAQANAFLNKLDSNETGLHSRQRQLL
ncbi:cryptochrome/photolyase family protein [Thalassospira profundimaris]|uniref:Deoxyribodipyrimidine photolyase n=1 Tax=Thalassospira profundimaris TaxID=502049 RepID=A0A367X0L9_9PROT|nr:cryptochrome/photolyase family protein [Thalassospira profundimaris]RCK47223.1 deoxyribodipyrimidine photolyase [Thalassospira profundimaris]